MWAANDQVWAASSNQYERTASPKTKTSDAMLSENMQAHLAPSMAFED